MRLASAESGGGSGLLEIPAGLLDDDPEMKPDKHIFVDLKSRGSKSPTICRSMICLR